MDFRGTGHDWHYDWHERVEALRHLWRVMRWYGGS